ncbi:prepilin-type N-terminal cleavage/methylation domain-containing protein [Thiomicrorhabdus sp. 6S2-11]|uniref:Prepilin-type N-terminal cleavage/methylation domain-containing protein n=1 Tax=Thiomicrorhabdus marina TaxID=2818442 RepID=A0ABS3Q3P2_9GAMM|nr:prepilin-type N-terminal cleavage/methylation domain-containing protein [Thiomicrorhabdus marina]MBO1926960.1 prepilin-type N-terminal cleavage/methylation domain-containing protein [Thiomicrorhabdus marina]
MESLKMKRNAQKGFTLVEIAIVLVIIGLLLGGVLKGQEMINSAKIKADTDALVGLQAAAYAYRDRTGYYPGDGDATNGKDGQINFSTVVAGTAASTDGSDFFYDLAQQGFLKSEDPSTEWGGIFAAGYVASAANGSGTITGKNQVCITNITDEDAELIATGMDSKLDDGDGTTGVVRFDNYGSGTNVDLDICLEI